MENTQDVLVYVIWIAKKLRRMRKGSTSVPWPGLGPLAG